MGRVVDWFWPEILSSEDAERVLWGAARVWMVIAAIAMILGLAPAVAALASDQPSWPLVLFFAIDAVLSAAMIALLSRLLHLRRSRMVAGALLLLLAIIIFGGDEQDGVDPFAVVLLGGIGLVTLNAMRAANAWHRQARSRIRWAQFGLAAGLYLALAVGSSVLDPDYALSWDYPQSVTWRSWAAMLLAYGSVLGTALLTGRMPVVTHAGRSPSSATATAAGI